MVLRLPADLEPGRRLIAFDRLEPDSPGEEATGRLFYGNLVVADELSVSSPPESSISLVEVSPREYTAPACDGEPPVTAKVLEAQVVIEGPTEGLAIETWNTEVDAMTAQTAPPRADAVALELLDIAEGAFMVRMHESSGVLCVRLVDTCSGASAPPVCASSAP